MAMVEQRVIVAKSLRREQLLAVQSAVRLAKLRVTLVGYLAEGMIMRHYERLKVES
jgi:uncharacterized membrane protein YhiD involved in acid resistance